MTDTITVPDYIKDAGAAAAYIRQELIKRNIDPDSIYPVGNDEGDMLVLTAPRAEPFMVEMSFTYDKDYKKTFEPKKEAVTMRYQSGFSSFGG